jgi:hypothetical protein
MQQGFICIMWPLADLPKHKAETVKHMLLSITNACCNWVSLKVYAAWLEYKSSCVAAVGTGGLLAADTHLLETLLWDGLGCSGVITMLQEPLHGCLNAATMQQQGIARQCFAEAHVSQLCDAVRRWLRYLHLSLLL